MSTYLIKSLGYYKWVNYECYNAATQIVAIYILLELPIRSSSWQLYIIELE